MARFRLHIAFEIGVILKGLNGLLELICGLLLLVFPPSTIQRFVVGLTHNELSKDPNDFIATHLRATAEHLSVSAQLFAALFLLLHGVIKVLLVYALLRRKLWAYPVAIGVFAGFSVYQIPLRHPTIGVADRVDRSRRDRHSADLGGVAPANERTLGIAPIPCQFSTNASRRLKR